MSYLRLLLLTLPLWLGGCQESILAEGQPAPALAALDSAGKPVALEDYRGKLVYLNFWSTGCGPCLVELPELARLAQELGPQLAIVNIAAENMEENEGLRELIARYQDAMPMVSDPLGITQERYQIVGYPSGALIGPDGVLLARYQGLQPTDALRSRFEEAMP